LSPDFSGKHCDFPCTLKAGIFSLKRFSLLSLKSVFDFFIALEQLETLSIQKTSGVCSDGN
jgi:hypothetical protein